MSTGVIIAIVVGALIILALLAFVLPRMRRQAEIRQRERELAQRRDRVAAEHHEVATQREREAQAAERRAQEAQAEAERQRAEAQMHTERADLHERGLADEQLIDEDERERFQPALDKRNADETREREGGGGLFGRGDDESAREVQGGRAHEPAVGSGGGGAREVTGGRAHEPADSGSGGGARRANSDYEQGRIDEREDQGRRL